MTEMWWLSFCDGDKPKGDQFLGVCLVEGNSLAEALAKAHTLDINPGGEVIGTFIPTSVAIPTKYIGILMDKRMIAALDKEMGASK
jgi:hypothetical protein